MDNETKDTITKLKAHVKKIKNNNQLTNAMETKKTIETFSNLSTKSKKELKTLLQQLGKTQQ